MPAFCSICLDDLYGDGECNVEAAPCGHVFHKVCVERALNAKKKCPTCRDDCQPYQLLKLFIEHRHEDGDPELQAQAGSSTLPIEIDSVGELVIPQMRDAHHQASLGVLQRRLETTEAERDLAKDTAASLLAGRGALEEQTLSLRNELQGFQRRQQMHDMERAYFKERIRKLEDDLLNKGKEMLQLKVEKQQMENTTKLQMLSSEKDLSEQEMLEMHANLIRVMDPREVMVTQAKSLLKANKLNRDLMKKMKEEASKKNALEYKLQAVAPLKDECQQLKRRITELERGQRDTGTPPSEMPDMTRYDDLDDIEDWSQKPQEGRESKEDSWESNGAGKGSRAVTVGSSGDRMRPGAPALRVERPKGSGGVSGAGSTRPPSFMRTGAVGTGVENAKYILSGSDGRGGRKTVLRGPDNNIGAFSKPIPPMAPWGMQDDLTGFVKRTPKRQKVDDVGATCSGPLKAKNRNNIAGPSRLRPEGAPELQMPHFYSASPR